MKLYKNEYKDQGWIHTLALIPNPHDSDETAVQEVSDYIAFHDETIFRIGEDTLIAREGIVTDSMGTPYAYLVALDETERICSHCGKIMNEGYYASGEYYCSDECLHEHISPEDWNREAGGDSDEWYWTQWFEAGMKVSFSPEDGREVVQRYIDANTWERVSYLTPEAEIAAIKEWNDNDKKQYENS